MDAEMTHMRTSSPEYLSPADLDWLQEGAFQHFTENELATNNIQHSFMEEKQLNNEKPMIRRTSRCRASKNTTSTIHLNATTKNFKDMVQRYTGCPPRPFSGSGGPLTICFDRGIILNRSHQQQPPAATAAAYALGHHVNNNGHQMIHQRLYKQQLIRRRDEFSDTSYLCQHKRSAYLLKSCATAGASSFQHPNMGVHHHLLDLDLDSEKAKVEFNVDYWFDSFLLCGEFSLPAI